MRPLFSLMLTGLLLTLIGCTDNSEQSYAPVFVEHKTSIKHYQFAIHPLHNPTRLYAVFNPLINYLNQNIKGSEFSMEASKSYADFNNKLQNQSIAFALPNPYQTLLAIDKGYQVIAKMGDDENFKGIFLVRKDSNIKHPTDLKGKVVSYPAPTALAATMLPQDYLQNNGINVITDIKNEYVGSQESSIMNVFGGLVPLAPPGLHHGKLCLMNAQSLKNNLKSFGKHKLYLIIASWLDQTSPHN